MTAFLFSLAGIPPMGGWWAKFEIFRVAHRWRHRRRRRRWPSCSPSTRSSRPTTTWPIAKQMWFMPPPDGDRTRIVIPPALQVALVAHPDRHAGDRHHCCRGALSDLTDFTHLSPRP